MVSAIILSHNDEDSIGKTIRSLSWCDEILVVDDYSVDRTVTLAKEEGALVFTRHLSGDFAAQRNFALEKAKREWVLFVDSDEIVSDELQNEIRSAVKNNDVVGYYVKRQDFLFGRPLTHGETANVMLLRLAKKNAGVWRRPVHEVWVVHGTVGYLSRPLMHYPHPNVAQFLDEINRYSSLNAEYLYSSGVKPSLWQIIAYLKAKFLVNYIWRMGFLDGTPGVLVALMMSFHSFLTRAKLYLLWKHRQSEKTV